MVYSVTKSFYATDIESIINTINKWTKDDKIEIQGLSFGSTTGGWYVLVYYNVRSTD